VIPIIKDIEVREEAVAHHLLILVIEDIEVRSEVVHHTLHDPHDRGHCGEIRGCSSCSILTSF
jgi:hypothetical protein